MKNIILLCNTLRTIKNIQRSAIFCSIIGGFLRALRPFVNIYFSARVIIILTSTKSVSDLVWTVSIAAGLNLLLFFLDSQLDLMECVHHDRIFISEHNSISSNLFAADYPLLENATFSAQANKYKEYQGSPFAKLLRIMQEITRGLCGLGCSIVLLLPFFKIAIKRSGDGFLHSPWMLLLLLGAILLFAIGICIASGYANKAVHKQENKFLDIKRIFSFYNRLLSDYNSGKEIRLFAEQNLIESQAVDELQTKGHSILKKIGDYKAISGASFAVIGAALGFGVYLLIALKGMAGLFGVDALVRYVGSFMQIVTAMTAIGMNVGNLTSLLPRFREFFYLAQSKATEGGNLIIETVERITFENVSFSYDEQGPEVLKNISIQIPVGDRIAIVGENGSGKTTFVKLLCNLYPLKEGCILVNDRDIRDYDKASYHKLFSVIFQDFKIFSLPLGENIASSEIVEEVTAKNILQKVGFINRMQHMPKGLETCLYRDCDSDGIEISGGEAQKLSLARALYKDAQIVILDEPTAALDPFAEQEFYRKFDELVGEKTVFYISHRLSSCIFCNKIAVFDEGKLVQFGTHEELISNEGGKYYALWMAQAQYYVNI